MIKVSFTQDQIEELRFEKLNHPNPRIRLKMEALLLKSQGFAHYQIQEICGISSVTLTTYIKQYSQGGIERLKLNRHKGKPNELQNHAEELKGFFEKNPPKSTKDAMHYSFSLKLVRSRFENDEEKDKKRPHPP